MGKRIFITFYCLAIAIVSIYVPAKVDMGMNFKRAAVASVEGYYFLIWSSSSFLMGIDFGRVAIELIAITAIFGALYIIIWGIKDLQGGPL